MLRKSIAEQRLLTCEQRDEYRKAINKARQDRYLANNKEKDQKYKKQYMKKYKVINLDTLNS